MATGILGGICGALGHHICFGTRMQGCSDASICNKVNHAFWTHAGNALDSVQTCTITMPEAMLDTCWACHVEMVT